MRSTLVTFRGTPWAMVTECEPVVVTIRDCREGFVRYFHGSGVFLDSTDTVTDFVRRFEPEPVK